MNTCQVCKVVSENPLRSCVCRKVFYCSTECQEKDWKVHKPSCPPYIIKESPGKGRGLFTTRKIKEGQIILEEYPLLTCSDRESFYEILVNNYPGLDENTKAKILNLNDPADDLKSLDSDTVEKLVSKSPTVEFWRKAKTGEISKFLRIISGNWFPICADEELYDTNELGVYNNIALINHGCVPNATRSWVMGDFKRQQVRAMKTIEKNEEILVSYQNIMLDEQKFIFGSREFRRQELLETWGFLCSCSECSLEGEELEENDRMRVEIREKGEETLQLLRRQGSDPVPRRNFKKSMKLTVQRTKLIQKLGLRAVFVPVMIDSYLCASRARRLNISILANDPDVFKQEAWKYAQMFGDNYIHEYKKMIN